MLLPRRKGLIAVLIAIITMFGAMQVLQYPRHIWERVENVNDEKMSRLVVWKLPSSVLSSGQLVDNLMKSVNAGHWVNESKTSAENKTQSSKMVDYNTIEKINNEFVKIKPQTASNLLSKAQTAVSLAAAAAVSSTTHRYTKVSVQHHPSPRLILTWTVLTQQKPLWGFQSWSFMKCAYKECAVTGNRSRLEEADLLLFRIRNLKSDSSRPVIRDYVSALDMSDMPPFHKHDQMWVDVNQESPIYTHSDSELTALDGAFNLSVTYLLNSDYPLSYIPAIEPKQRKSLQPQINYAAGKTKMALWFVSHCNAASGRDEYVQELMKHDISVDIFGHCTGKSDGCSKGNTTCYLEVRKKYKFYLAFENSICSEYITEKFWNTLQSESYNIPIALGASLAEYEKFSPPDSYLHTRNFTSAEHLAAFMHKLDKDDAAFNRYHVWRESYMIRPRSQESYPCWLCRAAHEKGDGNPEYKRLSSHWSRKKHCELQKEPA